MGGAVGKSRVEEWTCKRQGWKWWLGLKCVRVLSSSNRRSLLEPWKQCRRSLKARTTTPSSKTGASWRIMYKQNKQTQFIFKGETCRRHGRRSVLMFSGNISDRRDVPLWKVDRPDVQVQSAVGFCLQPSYFRGNKSSIFLDLSAVLMCLASLYIILPYVHYTSEEFMDLIPQWSFFAVIAPTGVPWKK